MKYSIDFTNKFKKSTLREISFSGNKINKYDEIIKARNSEETGFTETPEEYWKTHIEFHVKDLEEVHGSIKEEINSLERAALRIKEKIQYGKRVKLRL